MATGGKSIETFDISDVSAGCNYSDDIVAITKNQSPDSLNVEFFNGKIRKRFGERAINTPPTGQGGIDSSTKLMLHMDGTNGSISFVDSETTPKTVTVNGGVAISTVNSQFGGASGLFQGSGVDPFVVLMLHMDGTDTSTTFTDSSVSAKVVTAHGTAQLSTAQQKFGTASGHFSATGDALSLSNSVDFGFGTGDFTVDSWVRFTSLSDTQLWFLQRDDGNNAQLAILNPTSGTISFQVVSSAVTLADYLATGLTFVTNTWYHIALVRKGTNIYIFVNGVPSTLTINTAIGNSSLPTLSSVFVVAARQLGGAYDIPILGYLDEFRISKGIARWTTTFIPYSAAYTNTDSLTLANSPNWNFGTGDFTVDLWCNFVAVNTGTQVFYSQSTDANNYMQFDFDDVHGLLELNIVTASVASLSFNVPFSPSLSTWYHIALVRFGNVWSIYVNGVVQAKTLAAGAYTASVADYTQPLSIGKSSYATSGFIYGYIDEYRVSTGVARWTTNFTPPTLPYDTFNSSIPLVGFSLVDFSDVNNHHQQIAHLGTNVYAFDRVTSSNVVLRMGAPYIRSFNAKVGQFLIQTYQDYSTAYYWDGAAASMATLSPNFPGFKRAIEFQGYLIGMNINSAKTRCYYQLTGNIIGVGAAYTDYFTLTPAPNDDETSDAFLLNGRLYIGTKYSIFRVSFVGGVTVFEFKQVISDVGIVPETCRIVITKEFGQVALFLGTDKRIYMFDGANVKTISDLFYYHNRSTPIALDLIDDNYKENSFAVYDTTKRIYRLFVTKKASSTNYYCMNVDIDTFAYYPYDHMSFTAGTMGYDFLLRPYLVCTDYTGMLHQLFVDTSTDNGAAINEYYSSPLVTPKINAIKKGVSINIDCTPTSSANLLVYDRVDFDRDYKFQTAIPMSYARDKFLGQSMVLGSSKLGSIKDVLNSHINLDVSFNAYQFKLYSDTPTANPWEVLAMKVDQEVLKFGKSEAQR